MLAMDVRPLDWLQAEIGIPLSLHSNGQYITTGQDQRWGITDEEGRILMGLAFGRRVLEIGTGLGVSTHYMAQAALQLETLDPDEWVEKNIKLPTGVGRCVSREQVGDEFDLIFIDGLHDYESVLSDIEFAREKLGYGGIVAFHDHGQAGVRMAVSGAGFSRLLEMQTAGSLTLGWW